MDKGAGVGAVGAVTGGVLLSMPSVEVLQNGHLLGSWPATRLMRFPHDGHVTGGNSASAGLKHMGIPFS